MSKVNQTETKRIMKEGSEYLRVSMSGKDYDLPFKVLSGKKVAFLDISGQVSLIEAAADENLDVLIIEGLFALYLEPIRSKLDLKLYVDLDSDERLVRRIRRFTSFGQTFDEVTDRYIDTVRFRHNELIEPTRWHADMVVNGIAGDTSVDILAAYIDTKLKH